jgi:uncharacterized protein
MATYKSPGVFVEEISKFPATIAPVATAVPAFIGYTQVNPGEPRRISSMTEFIEIFGGPAKSVSITLPGLAINLNVNGQAAYKMFYAMQLYFGNGGGPCWVVSAGIYKTPTGPYVVSTELLDVLDTQLVREDEPTIIYFPDAVYLTTTYSDVIEGALDQCDLLKDRFVIADVRTNVSITTDSTDFRTEVTSTFLKYGAAYYPWLNTTLTYPDSAVVFAGAAPLATLTLEQAIIQGAAETGSTPISNALAPVLGPTRDVIAAQVIVMPPGGAMAGVYAAVDRNRGVWQAPANIGLSLVSSPTIKINDQDQEGLNVDVTGGKSINAIRFFTGKGTLVWGSRTLAGNDNEWRYIPVRRLFIFVEESISKATDGIVFEPNDANTWVKVKGMIQNFLNGLWRQGALAGAKPDDAFFVKVGLGETMSAQDILDGNLIVEIGMAAVRPAEFIILRFSHKLQVS